MTIQLRYYQGALIDGVTSNWNDGKQVVVAVSPTGSGKCLGRGTPILMYDGHIKPVEDVVPGDMVMGPDSTPRFVLNTCAGREMLYRVSPVKGDPYIVNESHVLSLKRTNVSNVRHDPKAGDIVNIDVKSYLKWSKWFRHIHKGWRAAVDFQPRNDALPLDPYFLGLWLGDGHHDKAAVSTGDDEIVEYLSKFAGQHGLTTRIEMTTRKCVAVHIVRPLGERDNKVNVVRRTLKHLGVWKNKHIPHAYKTASREDRLRLLAGLLDSDGHLQQNGFDITLKVERLFDDMLFVARSLGFACYKQPARKTCCNNGVTGNYFRTNINGPVDVIPFVRNRHREGVSGRQQIKDPLVTGITVEPVGEGYYFGFEVSGDHLFLLGDFTVTHNSATMARILKNYDGCCRLAIAHRQELVSQIGLALAKDGVRHKFIAPDSVRRACIRIQEQELGRSFHDPLARCAVAGVDTLIRLPENDPFLRQVQVWALDELHHLLKDNKWGRAVAMMPTAFGVGFTATPCRADGKGLGRHTDGLVDAMVEGPTMRKAINERFLTDYRIFAPPSDVDLSQVDISQATGDFNQDQVRKAVHKSHIVGDSITHYLRIAAGKRAIAFVVDVEAATEMAQAFCAAGVPAAAVSAKTPDLERHHTLRRFKNGELKVLVNVDLFGEGFDVPACEVVIMARPTQSYGLYVQQFGRALRPIFADGFDLSTVEGRAMAMAAAGKTHGIIIDHVGNVLRHSLPDAKREWTLDRRERKSRSAATDVIPVRPCPECTGVYERTKVVCPYCGYKPEPAERSTPEMVDGDLFELDPAVLARLRGDIEKVDGPCYAPQNVAPYVVRAINNKHLERQQAQRNLRAAMNLWAGYWRDVHGSCDQESYRRFYFTFGVDVGTAQTLGAREANELMLKVIARVGQ